MLAESFITIYDAVPTLKQRWNIVLAYLSTCELLYLRKHLRKYLRTCAGNCALTLLCMYFCPCLLAHLRRLLADLRKYLSTCALAYLRKCLHTYALAEVLAHLRKHLLTCPSSYALAFLRTCVLAHLRIYELV